MDRIEELVDGALAAGLGSAVAVSVGDGGVEVLRAARGHVRKVPDLGQPVDEHSWFDAASLTKPMSTVAIAMALVARGRLDIAQPVRRWLPDAATTGTVRDLLGHSAGCVAHVELFRRLRAELPADPYSLLVALAAREPAGAPGVTAVYSDLGFILLGRVLELCAEQPLDKAFAELVAGPLGLTARFAREPLASAVSTELDDRGLVCGLVHDENAYWGGRVCGHAGLFVTIDDVARFAQAIASGGFHREVAERFFNDAPTGCTWRLGWDTPSSITGVSQAGDRWPRTGAVGHTGFTGTSLWLDLPRRRWVALLTNRVHPTRHGGSADAVKSLRQVVGDTVAEWSDRQPLRIF
jgi:CubicO group peptidase (beta-lactamase class C family)